MLGVPSRSTWYASVSSWELYWFLRRDGGPDREDIMGRSCNLGFEYKVMVADGDASTYNAIKDTYGRSSVVKEMCAIHVGKRIKPAYSNWLAHLRRIRRSCRGEEGDKSGRLIP